MSFYLDVLIESILVSAPIPFVNNPTFFAMLSFGSYNMLLAAFIAVIGSAIGASLAYMAGKFFLKLYLKDGGEKHLSRENYAKTSKCFSRFFIYLLPFSFLPLLNFLALFAGFLGIRFKLVISFIVLGQIAYYGYYLYN